MELNCFYFLKVTLFILSSIVLFLHIIYILYHIDSENTALMVGVIIGLLFKISGIVAVIRHQVLLCLLYSIGMGIISFITYHQSSINAQFFLNLTTSIFAFIFAVYTRFLLKINSSESQPVIIFHHPSNLTSVPSAPPATPPSYSPPPSYSECIKH